MLFSYGDGCLVSERMSLQSTLHHLPPSATVARLSLSLSCQEPAASSHITILYSHAITGRHDLIWSMQAVNIRLHTSDADGPLTALLENKLD